MPKSAALRFLGGDRRLLSYAMLLSALVWLLLRPAHATHHEIPVDSSQEKYALNSHLSYFLDPDGDYTAVEVLRGVLWQPNRSGKVLNFGFTGETVWIRAHVHMPKADRTEWFLVIPYPLLEQVAIYVRDRASGRLLHRTSLAEMRRDPLLADFYYANFALPGSLDGSLDILVQVSSSTSLQVPLEIWSRDYLIHRQVMETLYWGIYFGIILALIAYNSFLFSSVRDPAYFYYVLYLASVVGLMLCLSGFGAAYVWPMEPGFHRYALPVFTGLASVWALLFARSFLYWQGFPGKLDRTMAAVAMVSIALIAYAWVDPIHGAQLSGWTGSLVITLILIAGINAWRGGVVIARYFVLAWLAFAFGASLYLLNVFGLIPVSRLSNHAVQVGSALDAVLLSFALAHRIKEERKQKLAALKQQHLAEQQMKQLQLQSLEQAMHDPATRMPNESLLIARLRDLIQARPLAGSSFAVVLFYLPQMKEISSSLGRGISESLFRSLIRDLNQLMARGDQAICVEEKNRAYLAVTEFGSLACICEAGADRESIGSYLERLVAYFDSAIDVGTIAVNLDIFIGIACYPEHGDRADVLLQHASAARDIGLRNGERICFYSPEMDAFGRRRLALMGALSRAIKEGELELYLQPQLQCDDLDLVGAEILLRWNSPKHGVVPTQEFIEIAESAGLMNHLTRYVLSRSLEMLRTLNDNGLRLSLSINLSVQNLIEPDFVKYVTEAAGVHQVQLSDIVLEVTETSLIEKIGTVIDNLERLAEAGCSIALDDFGTGYSSLAYLSRLPIHELKIDRSFISQMSNSVSDFRIVENTIKLARTLRIQTVAEGVEDSATLASIVQLGCNRVQGYHVGRPMPATQFHEWAMRKVG